MSRYSMMLLLSIIMVPLAGNAASEAVALLDEPFLDLNFKERGWSRATTSCSLVHDDELKRDVAQSSFIPGAGRPVTGGMGTFFNLEKELGEFTITFKEKVMGSSILGNQTIHGIYALTSSNDGTVPQRSRGTLYFDPSTSKSFMPGSWKLAFQDTVSMACPQGNADLYGYSEDRSVGGCQQKYQAQNRVWGFCTNDYCGDEKNSQSGWNLYPTANATEHPINHNEWVSFVYYVKLNTPGQFDGIVTLDVRGANDQTFVQTIHADRVMFRANGWNKDFKIGRILFGPHASANKYTFQVRWADLKLYAGDARHSLY